MKKPLHDEEGNPTVHVDLLACAFDKSWLGSVPRARIEQLRLAHRVSK